MPVSCDLAAAPPLAPSRGVAHYSASLVNRIADLFWERRLGIVTTGRSGPVHSEEINGYGFVAYHSWFTMLDHVGLDRSDVVVDLGAGKGRVVCIAATYAVNRVVGIEIEPGLAAEGARNAAAMRGRRAPIDFRCLSVTDYNYDDATVLTLFNPFGSETMHAVLNLLEASLARRPRTLRIVYCNPVLGPQLAARSWLKRYESWTPSRWSRMKFPVDFYRSGAAPAR